MNLHVPQSITTENELMQIAAVPYQIMSPKECKPLVAVVQDIALGIYRLTKKHITLHEKQLFNLMATNTKFFGEVPKPAIEDGSIKKWTGKQALSSIIPKNINIKAANNSFKPGDNDNYVIIENGEIVQGTIDKKIYQARTNGLIHSIYNDCNPEETRHFFDNTQKLICNWLVNSGFSVGISDLIVDDDTKTTIRSTINDMKVQAYDILSSIHDGNFENKSIKSNSDYLEEEINKILNKAREQTGKLGLSKINDLENRMINMIKSGSKGSVINVAQMIACLGQQNVDGKRIAYGFDSRTLPHFFKYDDGPESRGFVERSFIQGLSPQEMFFHAMGGREGLIDTAVKTSETGYIQRKLVKAMEDCKISYDYTVRNASGSIIQFLYGEDGMDPIKIEAQGIPSIDMDYEKLRSEYLLSSDEELKAVLTPDAQEGLKQPWEERMRKHFEQILEEREFMIHNIFNGKQESSIMYPVSFARIIGNAKGFQNKYGVVSVVDMTPQYVLDSIEQLASELYISKNNRGDKFIRTLINNYLSPKQVIVKHRLLKETFDVIISQVRQRFYDSIAHPSEMVGVVAAQSIGEPCTQMTLNTFHSSGISSASKAVRGVPRIKELLSVTKNIKGPSMTIHVKDEYKKDKMKCNDILKSLKTTFFRNIVKSSKIYYDPNDFNTNIEEDKKFMDTYKELVDNDLLQIDNNSPWLLRFEMDKDKMLEEGIYMIDLYNVIQDYYDDTVSCMFSDDNSNNLVFRIKIAEDGDNERDYITELKALEKNMMENILIKGVKNIGRAMMNKEESNKYNTETMKFEKTHEWTIDTSGTNLIDAMCHPKVDFTKTITNDVNEIYDVLGIEAARQALYNELSGVIDDAELYVNYRHIALLVDTMTNRGYLLSVDRHGINRVDIGPLAKCSFEETTDMLIKAGIFSEVDRITGVSANIMLGQIPPCGTGESKIMIDEFKLAEGMADIMENSEGVEDVPAACTFDELGFDFVMPNKTEDFEKVKGVDVTVV